MTLRWGFRSRWNLESFNRDNGFVSDLIMSTPVHCPANQRDKEQNIWWDSLLAMLGSSCLDFLKHPDWASSSLVLIWVRTSCVITSPWSERGTPYKATCNISINSDSTHSESSESKMFVKIFSDTRGTMLCTTLKLKEVLNKQTLSASVPDAAVLIWNSQSLE